VADRLSFWQVFRSGRRKFAELKLQVCILPSYSPKQSLAALLAAKSLGIRTVMMNESHAGTARAAGMAALVKRQLVGLFDAALVGGHPQRRYFTALGMSRRKIFTGYDAVNNDYFAREAEEIRGRKSEVRSRYGLPEHYFLSLGRFVAKKNLATLIRAYRKVLDFNQDCQTHLVMVGSGEEEPQLRGLCHELRIPIYDKSGAGIENRKSKIENELPGVHFYGFRQIEENPVFYALADAFILPSLWEEWGLVVNEAMASGLPVVVSEAAGCAEDLLEPWEGTENYPETTGTRAQRRLNGFVFDPSSVEKLSQVLRILEAEPDLRRAMGAASRRIVEKFSCENFAKNALLAAQVAMGAEPITSDNLSSSKPSEPWADKLIT
jgi:glycosyltransferase involved in cell wall biosynthesis